MAGNYPDAPSNRMEVDLDGTVGASITSAGAITTLTNAQLQSLNDESDASTVPTPGTNGFTAYIFPELRDIVAVFFSHTTGNATIAVSSNTTNGFDGTWTTVLTAGARTLATQPTYRTGIEAAAAAGIRGIRALSSSTGAPRTFHVYGYNSSLVANKLELWHPTLDQPLYQTPAALDAGDIMRNTTTNLTFRLKNLSGTLTANTITVNASALTDATAPTMVSGISFDYNGGGFAPTASLASLAPNTISAVFTIRHTVPSNVALGIWTQRVVASASTWS